MKKTAIICLAIIIATLATLKVRNYIVGSEIMAGRDSHSRELFLVPRKIDVGRSISVNSPLSYSVGDINFSLPRKDTAITFKAENVYISFKFQNDAHLLLVKDPIQFNFFKLLSQIKSADYADVKAFAAQNKSMSNFDLLLRCFNTTPNDISFFDFSRRKAILEYAFLKMKEIRMGRGAENGFYFFKLKHINGFQFGNAGPGDKTFVNIFTDKGKSYTLFCSSLAQQELDYILCSVDESLNR